MGLGMIQSATLSKRPQKAAASALLAGILPTAANPYFLLWWASVGARLVMGAVAFGLLGFAAPPFAALAVRLGLVVVPVGAGLPGRAVLRPDLSESDLAVRGAFLSKVTERKSIDA